MKNCYQVHIILLGERRMLIKVLLSEMKVCPPVLIRVISLSKRKLKELFVKNAGVFLENRCVEIFISSVEVIQSSYFVKVSC